MNNIANINNNSLNGLYNNRKRNKDKFYLLSEHSHIWANKSPVYQKCPPNMCLVFMTPLGYSSVEYIPNKLRKNLYSNIIGLQKFRNNPTEFLLKHKNIINYCNIIPPDHHYLDCSITLKHFVHEHKNQLGLYSLPLNKDSNNILQSSSLPKYMKVDYNNDYGKDIDLSKLIGNTKLFPKDKTVDLNIIFVDTCRVLWTRLPGISYQNEYISFKKAIYHNKNPKTVNAENGRFFTLKDNLLMKQNKSEYVLNILNEVVRYKNFEINRTKRFLRTFTIKSYNKQTQQLLNRYSKTTQNHNLKVLIKHIKSLDKNLNNFFKLRNANNQNLKDMNTFYIDKNINTTLKAILNEVS